MKILTKSDPESRNRELLDSIDPPYRVRITLQVKDHEGNYRPLSGSVLVAVKSREEVSGILARIEGWINDALQSA